MHETRDGSPLDRQRPSGGGNPGPLNAADADDFNSKPVHKYSGLPLAHWTIIWRGQVLNYAKPGLITARRPAVLYLNGPFRPVRWRRTERDLLSCWLGYLLADAWQSSAARRCSAWSRQV